MTEMFFQCVLAGVATAIRLQPTAAFLALPPQLHLPPAPPAAEPAALSRRAEQRPPSPTPLRSLISSWLPGADREDKRAEQQGSIPVTSRTLRAPLESFEEPQPEADGPLHRHQQNGVTEEVASLAGLLCLERSIPNEILDGLEQLAGVAVPFKVEVLRAGGGRQPGGDTRWYSGGDAEDEDDGWLETLVDPLGNGSSSSSAPVDEDGDGVQEALRWLKEDVRRVADVFSREVSSVMAAEAAFASGEIVVGTSATKLMRQDETPSDITVKLELLKRGKCPRFHLDKVPIRMICTYVGPTTVWLDGYDRWEMESNRSLPPACNQKISGGREDQRANPGDVLIFKGRPEGSSARGGSGARAVAHRSPDTVEGQKRLVLTMDVGDIIPETAAAAAAVASRRRS